MGSLLLLLVVLPFCKHTVIQQRVPEIVVSESRDFVIYFNDWFLWVGLGAWILARLLSSRRSLTLGPSLLFVAAISLFLIGLLGAPLAVDPGLALYHIFRLALMIGLYLMWVNLPLPCPCVGWAIAISTLIQGVIAVLQYGHGYSLGLWSLGELPLDPDWQGISVVMSGEVRALRAYGLTQHPNILGGYLMVFCLLLAGHVLEQPGRRRLPAFLAFGTGLVALLTTFSRAAWAGLLLGAFVMMGLMWWGRKKLVFPKRDLLILAVAGLVLVLIFAVFNWTFLAPRLGLVYQGVEIRSVEERGSLVQGAQALIRIRPWLGTGLGNFPPALYRLAPDSVADYPIYQPVHNILLLITAELGYAGGFLWLCLLILPWIILWRSRRRIRISFWFAGLSGALAALAFVSYLDHYLWTIQQGRLLWWTVYGLWAREWSLVMADGSGRRKESYD